MDRETAHRVRERHWSSKLDMDRFENERDALSTYHSLCFRGSADPMTQLLHPLYATLRYDVSCMKSLRKRVLVQFQRTGLCYRRDLQIIRGMGRIELDEP